MEEIIGEFPQQAMENGEVLLVSQRQTHSLLDFPKVSAAKSVIKINIYKL